MECKASTARSDLEKMLVDETAEPKALPLSLLEDITGGFSHDREIGSGGFAVVYKGILGNKAVAVKRLSNAFMDEKEFHREIECLMRVKQKYVVRFLGYCADRQGSMEKYHGKLLMADVHQRLLCFEYIPKGSLDKYITDKHREWGTWYKIIKGLCKGLQYLHENHIVHLDLKPANILLDDNMTPKITDFGLSRCFDENQSRHITKTILGTMGYLAPELREGGVIACSADLYSLGVIIIEILTGQKGYQDIEDVLESWSDRFQRSQRDTLCEQIQVCYEIALQCIDFNPKKRPASARHIIDRLYKMESSQTAEAASSTSGMAATESKGKSNIDDPTVFRSTPALRRGPQLMPRPAGPVEAHSDSHDGPNVYYSPKLIYLKFSVIAAHNLIGSEKGRPLAPTIVKIQNGRQIQRTGPGQAQGSAILGWNEEFIFVVSEPFEDPLVVTVEEHVGERYELIGRVIIPVNSPLVPRNDLGKSVPSKWFLLFRGMAVDEVAADVKNRESSKKFASKIHLKMSLETAYHVLDESTHFISDLQPAAKKLRKSAIGILEVGILSARNLAGMRNPYCVAKYGAKWVRTRTRLGTADPQWNEQYTWEVFDLSTVITVAVFNNANLHGHGGDGAKDKIIGKVRVRLATLESDRVHTDYYPLMSLIPSGLKKMGELHLAVRFACKSWPEVLAMYGKPLLPKIHQTNPISMLQLDYLRFQAVQMVATRLGRSEPPLKREVVEYMLAVDSHMFSLRRCNANFYRITSIFSGAVNVAKWFDGICKWKSPLTTFLVHLVFLNLVCYPELILPMVFLCIIIIGSRNYRQRSRKPRHIDPLLSYADQVDPDELDEEFDSLPTWRPDDIVRLRYDRLRNQAGKVQIAMGRLATHVERAQSLLTWSDPRATAIFITLSLVVTAALYLMPFRVVAMVMGLYFLLPPWFRSRNNLLFNLYRRLPSKDDMII